MQRDRCRFASVLPVAAVAGWIVILDSISTGATIVVDAMGQGDFSGIQDALDAAGPGDTVLVRPGEYRVASPLQFNRLRTEPGSAIDLMLRSEAGPESTVIVYEPNPGGYPLPVSAVDFSGGEGRESVLEGFTLKAPSAGAGIRCVDSSPAVRDCVVEGCAETAVRTKNGSPAFERCTIARNARTGLIASGGDVVLKRCRFEGNGERGVATSSGAVARLESCEIGGNGRGGVSCEQGSRLVAVACAIVGNRGGNSGGGLECRESTAELVNCLVVANTVFEGTHGAAMYAGSESHVRLVNCTVADNYVPEQGKAGLYCYGGGTFEVINSIVDGNWPPSWCGSVDHSIVEDRQPLFIQRGVFDLLRVREVSIAGRLCTLPDYILDPGDYRLLPSSPAIDAGDPSVAPETDLDGRRRACGAGVDQGAYERCAEAGDDCNENGIDDRLDVAVGRSRDCNANGLPDECDLRSRGIAFRSEQVFYQSELESMAAADLDGDGDTDLAVNGILLGLAIFLNDGGSLSFFWSSNVVGPWAKIVAGDVDGDGDVDLLGTRIDGPEVYLFHNKGKGLFNSIREPPLAFAIGGISNAAVLADLDLDGDLDVAAVNTIDPGGGPGSTVTILLNAAGSFRHRSECEVGAAPETLVAADLTGDAFPDLAVACAGLPGAARAEIRIVRNRTDGSFELASSFALGEGPYSVQAADVDRDRDLDLAVAARGEDEILVLANGGDGTFELARRFPAIGLPVAVVAGDVDGDALSDLVVLREGFPALTVLLGRGGGDFAPGILVPSKVVLRSMQSTDIEGDGDLDLLLLGPDTRGFVVLRNESLAPTSRDADQDRVLDECLALVRFHRGDPNADGTTDVSDAVCILEMLFLPYPACLQGSGIPSCAESVDANDDGLVDISDAIAILQYLFGSGRIPPPGASPSPCGEDPDPRGSAGDLGCGSYERC